MEEAIAPVEKQNTTAAMDKDNAGDKPINGDNNETAPSRITVSLFDYSVENHCRAIDTISQLCREPAIELEEDDIQRLSSSFTFIREWRQFCYKPRVVKFACKSESPLQKDVFGEIELPQFSSASVPKKEGSNGSNIVSQMRSCSSKDFIMYVGGSVWALDWCPRTHQTTDCDRTSEFVAVAAHPPDSSYHKIGAPLTGRGVVQIWCVLNVGKQEEIVPTQVKKKSKQNPWRSDAANLEKSQPKKPRGRPQKNPIVESPDNLDGNISPIAVQLPEYPSLLLLTDGKSVDNGCAIEPQPDQINREKVNVELSEQKKPRGRPKKKPQNESLNNLEGNLPNQYVQAVSGQLPEKSTESLSKDGISEGITEQVVEKQSGIKERVSGELQVYRRRTKTIDGKSSQHHRPLGWLRKKMVNKIVDENTVRNHSEEITKSDLTRKRKGHLMLTDPARSTENVANTGSLEIGPARNPIPVDIALPRVVLCLAHNGKVAWDVKWRPHDSYAKSKHSMGYLAVLLGNGALEVWDVPLPRATGIIYAACQQDGTDPRFVKLNPVFRCSKLKYGDRQSIPLTLEWSASSPHDLILAGCHDGVVALWKFSFTDSCKDTRPLLCFSADTSPIRTLAWAPNGSDAESSNIIVTAGHKGLKFWDLRDPFRPLWDLNPVQRVIYSLDWLPDPRCIIISFDDGTLRILTLSKAANDVPVTGKPFTGTQHQGLHSYYCSSFALWSVQVSRLTGMVAYCGVDGTVLRFQLTMRAVEKDPLRNRVPHFLCGSLTEEEESVLTIVSLLLDVPFPMKKSLNEWANAPRTIKGYMSVSNQEKRAKEKASKVQKSETLSLCYDEEPGIAFGSDDALMTSKSKQKLKAKSSCKKKGIENDQALVCRDNNKEDSPKEDEDNIKEETGGENEIDKFPPKIVAVHKVRWNMNKGSERWLCYGGAGGVVRCQEINLSSA